MGVIVFYCPRIGLVALFAIFPLWVAFWMLSGVIKRPNYTHTKRMGFAVDVTRGLQLRKFRYDGHVDFLYGW